MDGTPLSGPLKRRARHAAGVGRLALQGAVVALVVWVGDSHAHGGGGTPMPAERRPESTESRTPRRPSPPAPSQWPSDAESEAGRPGMVEAVVRRVEIGIDDSGRLTPDTLQFMQGETVRLRIRNDSDTLLAFVLGTEADIAEQAKRLQRSSGGVTDGASTTSVYPEQSDEIIWQFTRPGVFRLAAQAAEPSHVNPVAIITVVPPATAAEATASAATVHHDGSAIAAPAMPDAPYARGIIRKIDLTKGTLTLRHDPVKHLNLPGSTHVFLVKNAGLLQHLKAGDAVQFKLEQQEGAPVITDLRKAP